MDTVTPDQSIRAVDSSVLTRWAGDLLAVVVLVLALLRLLPRDGGFATLGLVPLMWWLLAAVPFVVVEARHLRRATSIAVGALSTAWVVAVVFGQFRSAFVDPLAGYALMVVAGLAAHRLLRRPWGSRVLIALLSGSFATAWVLGAAVWFGAAGQPRFLVLSWHNQSAAVMAGGLVWFAGLAWRTTGVARLGSIVGAGASLSGAYLTGSRGGILVAAIGLGLMAAVRPRKRWLVAVAVVTVAAAATWAFGLTFVDGASPLAQRGEGTAELNAVARFAHWEAAAGMFMDDPVTGLGIGSYGPAAPGFNRPDFHLTASAHNEFLELLAEGGLLVGIPALLLAAGGAVVAVRHLRREDSSALELAASGMVLVLGAHALIDFDWLFPTLAAMFAVGLGAVAGREDEGRWVSSLPVGVVVVAAVASMFLALHPETVYPDGLPWSPLPAINEALAVGDDDPAAALRILGAAHRWNPGNNAINALIPTYEAILGQRSVDGIVDLLELPTTRFATYDLVAQRLWAAGHIPAAIAVTEEALAALPDYSAWGPAAIARTLWETRLNLAHLEGGCPSYSETLARLEADRSFELYGFEIDRTAGLVAECA